MRSALRPPRRNAHEGSTLDDFLREEGLYEEATALAIKEVIARQLSGAMRKLRLTKTELAERLHTSRAALDRLLDPANESVTLATLLRAADALGLRLQVTLCEPEAVAKRSVRSRSRSGRR